MDQPGAPLQLELPLRFRRQRLQPMVPRRAPRKQAAQVIQAVQLQLVLVVVVNEAELWAEQPPVHRVVAAAGLPPPETRAPRSIWDLAGSMDDADGAAPAAPAAPAAAAAPQVIRSFGTCRVVGCAYPANRWTPEREEQERARRARQRPPAPVKHARTRSRKLIDLVGGG